jgi:hypothetical protein
VAGAREGRPQPPHTAAGEEGRRRRCPFPEYAKSARRLIGSGLVLFPLQLRWTHKNKEILRTAIEKKSLNFDLGVNFTGAIENEI